MKIFGIDNWDQFGNYIYTTSGVVFRNCIFTIFDSGELLGEDLQDVAVRLYNGVTIFDNCEFTNITVDYTDYSFGDGSGGAVRADGTSSTLHFNQSKLTNITVKRTNFGYIHGAVLSLDGEEPDVKLVNTIIADNSLSYEGPPDDGWPPSGGVIKWGGCGGHLQLINSTVVNNK